MLSHFSIFLGTPNGLPSVCVNISSILKMCSSCSILQFFFPIHKNIQDFQWKNRVVPQGTRKGYEEDFWPHGCFKESGNTSTVHGRSPSHCKGAYHKYMLYYLYETVVGQMWYERYRCTAFSIQTLAVLSILNISCTIVSGGLALQCYIRPVNHPISQLCWIIPQSVNKYFDLSKACSSFTMYVHTLQLIFHTTWMLTLLTVILFIICVSSRYSWNTFKNQCNCFVRLMNLAKSMQLFH